MKIHFFQAKTIFILCFTWSGLIAFAQDQETKPSWSTNPFEYKVFIENKGQFACPDIFGVEKSNSNSGEISEKSNHIQFAIANPEMEIYFTGRGVTYRHDEYKKEEIADQGNEKGVKATSHYLQMNWLNANPSVQIIAEDPATYYFTYSDKSGQSSIKANAYKKIIYKNLYPNIDVEYIFPSDNSGIKYSFILHPGANPELIKMKYENAGNLSIDAHRNVSVKSAFGEFVDHAPTTFYEGNYKNIPSSFSVEKNIISFSLPATEHVSLSSLPLGEPEAALIIDPWTTLPTFSISPNSAYDVDYDFKGNVYVYGGFNPFKLIKLNSAGVIQWVCNIPNAPNMGPGEYGDFAVDGMSGSSYVVQAYNGGVAPANMIKINAAGSQIGSFPVNLPMAQLNRIVYSNCTNRLIIAGGNSQAACQAAIMDTNGVNITNANMFLFGNGADHMALLAIDNSNNCYMASSIGYVGNTQFTAHDNRLIKGSAATLLPPMFNVYDNHGFNLNSSVHYIGSNLSGRTNGFNGMAVTDKYLYTYDSQLLQRWNKNNGALINSNGLQPCSGFFDIKWGGIAVDDCENIYRGYKKNIVRYDTNFTVLSTMAAPDTVFDIRFSPNGNKLYACGKGFVSEFHLDVPCASALNLTASVSGVCTSSIASATVTATGGTGPYSYLWSPIGKTTEAVTGLSAGDYVVTVMDNSCVRKVQTLSLTIYPPSTPGLAVNGNGCKGTNTILTASGGGTYQWNTGASTAAVTITPTINTTYTVIITDNNGCIATRTVSITVNNPPVIVPVLKNPILCNGYSTGVVTVTVTTGTPGYTYSWSNGKTTPTISNLASSVYSVSVTDASGCVATAAINITQPAVLSVTVAIINTTKAVAIASGGVQSYSYLWSNSQNNATATGLLAGTAYTVTVTDANDCTASAVIVISTSTGIADDSLTSAVFIYPNPTNGEFVVEVICNDKNDDTIELVIYNISGQLVYKNFSKASNNRFREKIVLNDMSDGLYYLRLKTEEEIINKKIILAR